MFDISSVELPYNPSLKWYDLLIEIFTPLELELSNIIFKMNRRIFHLISK